MTRVGRRFAGYAFDLDGTVYLGDSLLPHAAETIRTIRAGGGRVVFVTNKPLETAADYAAMLSRLGIPAKADDIVTALDSLFRYMEERHAGARVLPVTEPLVAQSLTQRGFEVTADPAAVDVVVVAFDRTFDYAKLNAAYRAVKLHGAALVATNPDPYCPTPDGGLPDCAAMLAAIEASSGGKAEAVLGKPSPFMARAVLARLATPAHDAALVGDRIATDIAMARTEGMTAILVLTGASSRDDVQHSALKPDFVIESLAELLPDS